MNLKFECGNGDCTFSGPKKDLEEHEETCESNYEDVDISYVLHLEGYDPEVVVLATLAAAFRLAKERRRGEEEAKKRRRRQQTESLRRHLTHKYRNRYPYNM